MVLQMFTKLPGVLPENLSWHQPDREVAMSLGGDQGVRFRSSPVIKPDTRMAPQGPATLLSVQNQWLQLDFLH